MTRTRYTYTEEKLDTINREFEDLITGTMTIHELDVRERFQNRPALQYLELMSKLGTGKLTNKVRMERKAYKAKTKRKGKYSPIWLCSMFGKRLMTQVNY